MSLEDCPRCHGGKYVEGKGYIPPKSPRPTLRVENVMSSTMKVYYHCGNCCYKEQRSYGADDKVNENNTKTLL
jgi:hypothetical protein